MNKVSHKFYRDEEKTIQERLTAIQLVIDSLLDQKVITRKQLNGYVIDLFSYVGTAAHVLRRYGGQLTIVEGEPSCIKNGIGRKYIDPEKDILNIGGEDVEMYLSAVSEAELNADIITAFGTRETYFKDPHQFYENAMKCLGENGVLIMTGTYQMKEIFEYFQKIFGGALQDMGENSHPWDRYRYIARKK